MDEGDDDDGEAILAMLAGARPRTDPETAERAVRQALAAAPTDFVAQLAAYKFFFYSHRLAEALPHAQILLDQAARRLNVPLDWRAVARGDAAFDQAETAPGLYLQALIAWAYCLARLGQYELGCEALAKAGELDPRDRFGARRLLKVVEDGPQPEED